jgi:hypothetical protein
MLTCCGWSSPALTAPLGTAFSYRGQLSDAGVAASGTYDLQACLFDESSAAQPLACLPDFEDVAVQSGSFQLDLDFGAGVFIGELRWLELRVRPGSSSGAYTVLAPRTPLRAVPESLRAAAASSAPWSGLTGVPAGFADGIDNGTGTVTAVVAGAGLAGGTITGSGTLSVAPGGVTGSMIAAGAVGATQIAAGAVGADQIDVQSVQRRILAGCVQGQVLRAVNADGSVVCDRIQIPPLVVPLLDNGILGGGSDLAISALALAVDANGRAFAAALAGVGPFVNTYAIACIAAGCPSTTVNPIAGQLLVTDVAIGADGLPLMTAHISASGAFAVIKCNDFDCSTFSQNVVQDEADSLGTQASIAFAPDGLPFIAYDNQTGGKLRVVKCNDARCAPGGEVFGVPLATFDNIAEHFSLVVPADGFPVIALQQISFIAPTTYKLLVVRCNDPLCAGFGEPAAIVDAGSGVRGIRARIGIGANGFPVVAHATTAPNTVRVIECDDPACADGNDPVVRTVVLSNTAPPVVQIASGPGALAILVAETSSAFRSTLIRCRAGGCGAVAGSAATVGSGALDVAIDAAGRPKILWQRQPSDGLSKPALLTLCQTDDCL